MAWDVFFYGLASLCKFVLQGGGGRAHGTSLNQKTVTK